MDRQIASVNCGGKAIIGRPWPGRGVHSVRLGYCKWTAVYMNIMSLEVKIETGWNNAMVF